MPGIVHSIEAIEALLRRGEMPKTDNREALVALGFEPSMPRTERAEEDTLWERSIDRHDRAANGQRLMVRERAILERDEASLN